MALINGEPEPGNNFFILFLNPISISISHSLFTPTFLYFFSQICSSCASLNLIWFFLTDARTSARASVVIVPRTNSTLKPTAPGTKSIYTTSNAASPSMSSSVTPQHPDSSSSPLVHNNDQPTGVTPQFSTSEATASANTTSLPSISLPHAAPMDNSAPSITSAPPSRPSKPSTPPPVSHSLYGQQSHGRNYYSNDENVESATDATDTPLSPNIPPKPVPARPVKIAPSSTVKPPSLPSKPLRPTTMYEGADSHSQTPIRPVRPTTMYGGPESTPPAASPPKHSPRPQLSKSQSVDAFANSRVRRSPGPPGAVGRPPIPRTQAPMREASHTMSSVPSSTSRPPPRPPPIATQGGGNSNYSNAPSRGFSYAPPGSSPALGEGMISPRKVPPPVRHGGGSTDSPSVPPRRPSNPNLPSMVAPRTPPARPPPHP